MQMINPIKMNNWDIKKFLIVISSIQIFVLSLIILNNYLSPLTAIRQIICFVYLLFVPGILILRILRLHDLDNIETILFTVGLSIVTLMLMGVLINVLYPFVGINTPFSTNYLVITISLLVIILGIMSYIFDKNYSKATFFNIKGIISNQSLLLLIFPFFSIFAAYLMNSYKINIGSIILIFSISLVPILVAFDKINEKYYYLTVYTTSISLLFFVSLISNYIVGGDIVVEYYYSNLVLQNGVWIYNPTINLGLNVNSMLSIVTLAPIIAKFTNLNLIWVFKIFYQLIYSLVPLGLYKLYKGQTNPKIAFFATFFFMATFSFYSEMIVLARQQIAELFFILMLIIICKKIKNINFSILFLLFSVGLITSHYGLSYFFILYLISFVMILYSLKLLQNKFPKKISLFEINIKKLFSNKITKNFALFFIISSFFWYIYTSNASIFYSIVHIGDNIISNIYSEFLNPDYAQGVEIIQSSLTPMYSITKYLHLISQFFITLGLFVYLFLRNRVIKLNFSGEYLVLALISFLILILSFTVPFFSGSMQTSRVYHITQFLLVPFFIIGFIMFYNIIRNLIKRSNEKIDMGKSNFSLKIVSIFMAIFLVFNSGLAYELSGEIGGSISLISFKSDYNFPVYNEFEFSGAEWINNKKSNGIIYSDNYRSSLFAMYGLKRALFSEKSETYFNAPNAYIFMGRWNVLNKQVLISSSKGLTKSYKEISTFNIINNKNKIYSNNGTEVYITSA